MSNLLTLNQAAKRYYPGGTAVCTLIRHIKKGVLTPSGRVKLEADRIGGRWVTTADAVERFREACTTRAGGEPKPERTTSYARADAHLRSLGL